MMKANNEIIKAVTTGLLVLGGCKIYHYQNILISVYSVLYISESEQINK